MFIIDVVKSLNKERVKFAVAGGYAVALHGAVRGTVDIDLVLALDERNYSAAEKALKALGLQPRLPVAAKDVFHFRKEYIRNKNLIAWSFVNPKDPSQLVDIIITHDLNSQSTIKISLRGEKVPVLSKRSLIAMKKAAGRPQDLEDIRALEELP